LGAILLFWLPVEDLDERWVILLAAAVCLLAGLRFFLALQARVLYGAEGLPGRSGEVYRFSIYPFTGALAGLAVSPVAVLLMVFKSGLHSHPSLDFTPAQVMAVLGRAPYFALGGFLLGIVAGILRKTE
jgi:hypothetical protein